MKLTTLFVGLSLLVACCAPAAWALSEVHIDFQPTTGTVAAGYTAVTNANRWDNSTTADLGNGVRAGWLTYLSAGTFDRGSSYPDALTRDAVSWSSSTPAQTLKIAGLEPGAYNLKIYSTDPQFFGKQTTFDIDGSNDGTSDLSITIKNPLGEYDKTVPVTVSSAGILTITIDGIGTASGAINGLDLTTGAPDTSPPASVADLGSASLTSTSVTLHWTAPADDNGTGGRVASYDVRYSTALIDDTSWASASQATGEPSPANPGQAETFTVTGLSAGTTYYFAAKSADFASPVNVSPLSNVPSARTLDPDLTSPAAVTDLAAVAATTNQITLRCTAPTDDSGKASSYDLRYSTSLIDATNWASATQVTGEPVPANPGQQDTFAVSGLSPSTTYYFAVKSVDASGNVSGLSNVPSGTTQAPDTIPPATVGNLSVAASTSYAVSLTWTAPADNSGKAASYDVRYSTSLITAANWSSAAQAAGEPAPANPGQAEAFTVAGLRPSTTYYFAMKSSDASSNISGLSNVVTSTTLEQPLRSEVHVDFQVAGCVTAPGYVAALNTTRWDMGTIVDLGGGAQGGWTAAFVGDYRDRGTADPLTRDFLLLSSTNPAQVFQLRGIQPGTYNLKLYATDTQFHGKKTSFIIDQNNDGTADTTVTVDETVGESSKTAQVSVSMAGIISISCSAISSEGGVVNGLDLVTLPDTFAPGAVADLAVTAVNSTQATLRWTAPADDNGKTGGVGSYDVRYSTNAIDTSNWAAASQATGEPTPANPGQPETLTISGLTPGTTYYFAVKSADRDNNVSLLSNVPSRSTEGADTVPPAAATDLAAIAVDANELTLTWTATGDDGVTGLAAAYSVRYSTSPFVDDATFAAATEVTGVGSPKPVGSLESVTVTGLTADTHYWFAIKVADEMPNWSALSNVVQVTTLPADVTPPAAITDLAVADIQSTYAALTWTAPGDDAAAGTAAAYDIRYSTSPITEATFAAAQAFAAAPAPLPAGNGQVFIGGALDPDTTYYFAVKARDNGVPANVSALSNVVTGKALVAGSLIYGVSSEFSLEAAPTGPYAPAVAVAGAVSITNINVDPAAIVRTVKRSGPVYTGLLQYNVAAPTTTVHVWLELSTDGGQTWSQRRIHAVGAVGTISSGVERSIQWTVDGNHGNHCRIRVRVNSLPATYSDLDADNNKYPRPAPWAEYPNIERLGSSKDFIFGDSHYTLPHVDFYKAVTSGQVKAGFSRTVFFSSGGQYFLHCGYLESADGQQKWVILQGDVQKVWTDTIHRWRNQINATYGIPQDHVMVLFTHVHNGLDRTPGNDTFPTSLLNAAIANAQPVEVGWLNKDMGTAYNLHRDLYLSPTQAVASFSNGWYDGGNTQLPIIWQYDTGGKVIGAMLDGTPYGSPVQKHFDCPLDSYLQMIVFRNADTHAMTGTIVKFTGHPVGYDYIGDMPRAVMDVMRQKFGNSVEVMFTCGYGGNHRPLTVEKYPADQGSLYVARALRDALDAALPTMEFKPLYKLGMVMGYDTFGKVGDSTWLGIDPDRLGTGVQVYRFNDIYLSTLPGEAPSEQGLYIRGRTSDLKHMYNAYGNTWYNYYCWGRWFDVTHFEQDYTPNRYESFRMAQEIVRGVDILEQSVDALHLPGDVNNDGACDVVDLLCLVDTFGLVQGDAGFNVDADFNADGSVDVVDLLTFVDYFGKY